MVNRFTQKAQNALRATLSIAAKMGHTYIGSEHLLLGLMQDSTSTASKLLESKDVQRERLTESLEKLVGKGEETVVDPSDMTPRVKHIIEHSARLSRQAGTGYIGTEHLLLSILSESDSVALKILREQGVDVKELEKDTRRLIHANENEIDEADDEPPRESTRGTRKRNSSLADMPTLQNYGRDLTAQAKEGTIDPIIGREDETARVIQILCRRQKNNPCLIGEPGVGKTAVVEGLAERIAEGRVPELLQNKKVVTLDVASMVAGAKYRGEFEERMKGVMAEVREHPDVILFIDEIHTIVGAGGAEGAVDAANIIKPALARGEMQVIGATTITEYRKHIEKDAALERRFQSVTVGEPTPAQAEQILFGLRDKYEAHHKLKISDEAIKAAVKLSVRYITDRFLPDKAIDLVDEAAAKLRIRECTSPDSLRVMEDEIAALERELEREKEEAVKKQNFELAAELRDREKEAKTKLENARADWRKQAESGNTSLTAEDIADVVTLWTGIPVQKLQEEEGHKLAHLEDVLKARVIGQDEAVEKLARAIKRGRMGLKDPKRPIGSFLFLGPTGVGKTELCKVLADSMFGTADAIVRVDMSEYMEKHSVSKLIGSPPGYVGFEEGGQLTEKIRRKPYSVVLFDEIEKAHPDVFNILLQILEDGILTDSQGRRVDFKNTVIIMTSNVGAMGITESKPLGFSGESSTADAEKKADAAVRDALKATFRPEFLNRLDEIIVFRKLSDETIRKIASLMLLDVTKRTKDLGIDLSFSDELIALIAKEGFDPVYGARPLRRAVTHLVEDALSGEMLEGKITAGDQVLCTVRDGKAVFEKTNG